MRDLGRPILVDVTRLQTRRRFGAPTGIDRVELAYAERYLRDTTSDAVSLTPLGPRLPSPERVRGMLDALSARWHGAEAPDDPVAARVQAWLSEVPGPPPPPLPRALGSSPLGRVADRARHGFEASLLRDAERHAPRHAIYLHVSHLRLDRPPMLAWLARRPDIRPVFFVQDLIPIEFPEYGVPGEAQRHRIRVETVCRHAAAVVTSSDAVAAGLRRYAAAEGLPVPERIVTAPIGVEEPFLDAPFPFAAARPYFVVCSTIEGRKNHLLLLQLWRDLARRLAPGEMPALVVVGRRGWESEAAIDLLERCEAIRPHVIEAPNLPTGALASLMAGARALLMPSFSEGYGVPVAEAVALGTPVIASDIPSHREITRGEAVLLDPLDGPAWREAIREAAAAPLARRTPRAATWDAHFAIVERLLAVL